ncbi:MAG TPA: hypothetical protein VNA25_08670 [Phycisphaerae bacterium]|nr:hypothetical protein [Phycisphaerae bacterium]
MSFWNPDAVIFELEHFKLFPHALLQAMLWCLRMAKDDVKAAASLKVMTLQLARDALSLNHPDRPPVVFARLAYVFELVKGAIQAVLGEHRMWDEDLPEVFGRLATEAASLGSSLRQEAESRSVGRFRVPAVMGNDGRIIYGARQKRIAAGGAVWLYSGRDLAECDGRNPEATAVVVDYSWRHILCILDTPIDGIHTARFLPCKRELPFVALAYPDKRSGQTDPTMAVGNPRIRTALGPCCQLLALDRAGISPDYYYLALCASRTSSHAEHRDDRFIERHDLGPGEPPPKPKCPMQMMEHYELRDALKALSTPAARP